jgi:dihydroorotase
VVFDPEEKWQVTKDSLYYRCEWSPLEGREFQGRVVKTFINGTLAFDMGQFRDDVRGMRLEFDRR